MRRRYKRKPFRPISHETFRQTRQLARLTQEDVACLLHVTPRTVFYWESGQVSIPYAAFRLLRIHTGYELPGLAWKGWSLHGDTLWSPEGRGFKAGHLAYLALTVAMAESWRKEQREKAQRPWAQPGPLRLRVVKGRPDPLLPDRNNPDCTEEPGQELA